MQPALPLKGGVAAREYRGNTMEGRARRQALGKMPELLVLVQRLNRTVPGERVYVAELVNA